MKTSIPTILHRRVEVGGRFSHYEVVVNGIVVAHPRDHSRIEVLGNAYLDNVRRFRGLQVKGVYA